MNSHIFILHIHIFLAMLTSLSMFPGPHQKMVLMFDVLNIYGLLVIGST